MLGLINKRKVFKMKIIKKLIKKINKKKLAKTTRQYFYNERYIYSNQDGSNIISKKLEEDKPCLIARLGGTELRTLNFFLANKESTVEFNDSIKENMTILSGFFPSTDDNLIRFCCEYIQAIKNVDAMAVWFLDGEKNVCETYCPEAKLFGLSVIGDYIGFLKTPWTKALEGKKVLVIHPFEETIKKQYKKRELLFKNPDVLPQFELKTIKAVQSLSGTPEKTGYSSWFEALEDMCRKINETNFDIALIGAGAYGMFLGEYCKRIGKKAVHVGGALQLLFGIKGKRWVEGYGPEFGEYLFNEHWVYPCEEEQIEKKELVEDSSYW